MPIRANVLVMLCAALFLAGLAIGATINGWRLGGAIESQRALHVEQISQITQAAAQAAAATLERERAARSSLAVIDQQYTQELQDARTENDKLRDAVAAGERRLRIQATCSDTGSSGVSDASGTASVDDDAGTRPTPAAERNYWVLMDRIATATAQINGLQDYIRSVCQN